MDVKEQAKQALKREAIRQRATERAARQKHEEQDDPTAASTEASTARAGSGGAIVDLTVPSDATSSAQSVPGTDSPRSNATADAAVLADSADGDDGRSATTPADVPSGGWKDILRRAVKEVGDDNVPMIASAVAFAGFLSLFPAIIAALSVYSLVTDPAEAARQAADLTATLPQSAANLLTDQMQSVAQASDGAAGFGLVVSVLAALWGASGGMGMLIKGVTVAYDEENDRGFVKNRGLAMLLALGAILFFGVVITLLGVIPAVMGALGTAGTILSAIVRWGVLVAVIMAALAVLYRVGPDREDARWAWVSPGAVTATVLWLAATAGFAFFVNNFGSYNETYGTAAGVVVLLLWLQITALVILLGAEVNAEAERQTARDTTTGPPEPIGQRGAVPADEVATG